MNFNISEIADILCLERKRRSGNRYSFNVKCPFCDRNGHHLNINNRKNVWRCVKCGEHGGMIDLYLRIKKGLSENECNKKSRRMAAKEIESLLHRESDIEPVYQNTYIDDYSTLSDSELNMVYSKILDIPELKLCENHRKNLHKRGLNDTAIQRNGYRSLPEEICIDKDVDIAVRNRIGNISYISVKDMPQKCVPAGLYIAAYLMEKFDVRLDNVPGFFKLNGRWCFAYTPGLLIPVRNMAGEIVSLQIRTAKGKNKYITASSKKYEGGISGRCRVHFPACNPELGHDTIIRLTEGPLKADAAAEMTTEPDIAYMAIMGINATTSLSNVIQEIKDTGCNMIVNALDMDRLTNPYVAKGSRKIGEIIRGSGLKYQHLFWDTETAEQLARDQKKLMLSLDIISDKKYKSVFQTVAENTMMFFSRGIEIPRKWPNKRTKGIDDYYNTIESKY